MYFVFLYVPGASWLTGNSVFEQPLGEHFAYMTELEHSGVLKLGGAFTDSTGAMGIIEVDTLEEARDVVLRDPAVKAGIVKASVHPWSPSVTGCIG